jgi:hypothetical protein
MVNLPEPTRREAHEMSGSVARNMPGSGSINGNNPKPGTLLTADAAEETQGSLHWMARRTTGTRYSALLKVDEKNFT